jgi:hypothetical protein
MMAFRGPLFVLGARGPPRDGCGHVMITRARVNSATVALSNWRGRYELMIDSCKLSNFKGDALIKANGDTLP